MFAVNTHALTMSDIKKLQRDLKEIEPTLLRDMRREIKAIAKPIENRIKTNIPKSPPMSGMAAVVKYKSGSYAVNEGRLRWDGQGMNPSAGKLKRSYKPDATSVRFAGKSTGRSLTTPLVKVIMQSAAVSMVFD